MLLQRQEELSIPHEAVSALARSKPEKSGFMQSFFMRHHTIAAKACDRFHRIQSVRIGLTR